jgi:cytochrome P450
MLLRNTIRILDQEIQKLIQEAVRNPNPSSKAIIHLALKDRPLTPAVLEESADQLRTFIFAGFDTTSTTLQWAFYYLSLPQNAAALEALCSEHDQLLGPVDNKDAIEAFLRTDPVMPYTTAVIKESLRMEPPAATARWVPSSHEPFYLTGPDGIKHCVNGTPIYINHRIILQSTKFWGPDAKTFRPERWLDKEYVANLPAGVFRPFERGPRGCIGQELAMMEAKVVLALTARRFTFKKWTPPEEVSDLGDVWNIYNITATPNDAMRMTIKKRC